MQYPNSLVPWSARPLSGSELGRGSHRRGPRRRRDAPAPGGPAGEAADRARRRHSAGSRRAAAHAGKRRAVQLRRSGRAREPRRRHRHRRRAAAADGAASILDNLPEPFRDFFNQFGQGGQQQPPHKAICDGLGLHHRQVGLHRHQQPRGRRTARRSPSNCPTAASFDAKLDRHRHGDRHRLLKVKTDKPLPTVEFGDDRQVRVGDWVVAVGNPFGLSNTVTAGIVSSIGRDIGNGPYTDFIQIDAPDQPRQFRRSDLRPAAARSSA